MKHQWERDDDGALAPVDEDWPFDVRCILCGHIEEIPQGPRCEDLEPPVDGCQGVSLDIIVTVAVCHPGKATKLADHASLSSTLHVPMSAFLDSAAGTPEPIEQALADTVNAVAAQWRTFHPTHRDTWALAHTTNQQQQPPGG